MKHCFKCGEWKSADDFYRHPRMADGRLNKCKECTKRDVSVNYHLRHEQYAQYERDRSRNLLRIGNTREYQRRHRTNHPDRYAARNAVNNAIRDGRLKRQPCKWCGVEARVQAHHHDYSKPLDVTWVCFKCHREREHGQQTVDATM